MILLYSMCGFDNSYLIEIKIVGHNCYDSPNVNHQFGKFKGSRNYLQVVNVGYQNVIES